MESQPLPTELVIPHQDWSLVCRPATVDDIPALVEACQDPEISRWTTVPWPYGAAEGRGFVELSTERWANRSGLEMVITPGTKHPLGHLSVLGTVGARIDWTRREAGVGYWIHVDARRKGVAGTVLAGLCRWLLDLGMQRVQAEVMAGNDGSAMTLESVGFRLEGTLRSVHAGRCGVGLDRIDEHIFGLLPAALTDRANR